MAEDRFHPIIIRYDGLDADQGQIELAALAKSLEGASKLIGVAAHYVVTGQYVKKAPALAVRVLARETRSKCFEIVAVVTTITSQTTLPFLKELGSHTIEYIVNYILAKFGGRKSDMDRMLNLIEKALAENGLTARAALDSNVKIVEALAANQRPAARMFVTPVGTTCATARLGGSDRSLAIDKAMRDAITAPDAVEISEERTFRVLISELDMQTGGCKVSIEDDEDPDRRCPCEVIDPLVKTANNPYVAAMKEQLWVTVQAKAQIKDGDLDKLYISDVTAG